MDNDNPLSGIIGMVVMISVLPMILQMLSGLTGGQQQQGPPPGYAVDPLTGLAVRSNLTGGLVPAARNTYTPPSAVYPHAYADQIIRTMRGG